MEYEHLIIIEDIICTVCQENMYPIDNIVVLPCIHTYHKKCIQQWYNNKNTCPECRAIIDNEILEKKIIPDAISSNVTTRSDDSMRNRWHRRRCLFIFMLSWGALAMISALILDRTSYFNTTNSTR